MKNFKKLVGEKIYLSPINIEDVEKYTEWINDFHTTDYTGRSSNLYTIEGEQKCLEKIVNSETDRIFAIIDLNGDKLIGNCGIHKVDFINRTAVLGIFIGDKEGRNRGAGTEAIKLLLDFGFNYLNLHSISLDLIEFNERALACYKKCGFKECGRRRESKFINGKYYDSIRMDILEKEFEGSYIKNKNI